MIVQDELFLMALEVTSEGRILSVHQGSSESTLDSKGLDTRWAASKPSSGCAQTKLEVTGVGGGRY